jgi:hypothetical protein
MQKDTFDTFSGFCKNQKVSSMINESQTVFLLTVVNLLLFSSEISFIRGIFPKMQELIDPLIPHLVADH